MRPPPRLSNCYTPLPRQQAKVAGTPNTKGGTTPNKRGRPLEVEKMVETSYMRVEQIDGDKYAIPKSHNPETLLAEDDGRLTTKGFVGSQEMDIYNFDGLWYVLCEDLVADNNSGVDDEQPQHAAIILTRKEQILAKRKETRQPFELRRLLLESNVIQSAAASCLVELGNTKVLCSVIGPVTSSSRAVPSSLQLDMDRGTLYVQVKYAENTGYPAEHLVSNAVGSIDAPSSSSQQQQQHLQHKFATRAEAQLAQAIVSALTAAVPLQNYPKCCIVISLTILQDDGSVLPACLTAAAAALPQAGGLEVYDLPSAVCVAIVQQEQNEKEEYVLLADPTLDEMSIADSIVEMTLLPNWKEVVHYQQQQGPFGGGGGAALLSPAVTNQAVDLCRDGCRTMHKFLREHLLSLSEQQKDAAS